MKISTNAKDENSGRQGFEKSVIGEVDKRRDQNEGELNDRIDCENR